MKKFFDPAIPNGATPRCECGGFILPAYEPRCILDGVHATAYQTITEYRLRYRCTDCHTEHHKRGGTDE